MHGSWVAGDFKLGRSDLDLLAVLAEDPDEGTLARLTALHADISAEAPDWDYHVEVDDVSVAAVRSVLAGDGSEHSMVRISPGEPIHLVHVDRTPYSTGVAPESTTIGSSDALRVKCCPPSPTPLVREVVIEHARQWPAWLDGASGPEFQAHAVLTSAERLPRDRQAVVQACGGGLAQELPPSGAGLHHLGGRMLVRSAPEVTPDRTSDVTAFVQSTSWLIVEN